MENPTPQHPYTDSSAPQTPTTPTSTSKPLPALPISTPPYQDDDITVPYHDDAPYRDDPPTPSTSGPPTTQHQIPYTPYTDNTPPLTPTPQVPFSDDDIPLAHFLQTYPSEAPPSYAVATRQSSPHASEPLIAYIPSPETDPRILSSYHHFLAQQQGWSPSGRAERSHRGRSVVLEIDEEAGEGAEEMSHSVERIVAMFVVAGVLLVMSGVMAWLAFGSGLV